MKIVLLRRRSTLDEWKISSKRRSRRQNSQSNRCRYQERNRPSTSEIEQAALATKLIHRQGPRSKAQNPKLQGPSNLTQEKENAAIPDPTIKGPQALIDYQPHAPSKVAQPIVVSGGRIPSQRRYINDRSPLLDSKH